MPDIEKPREKLATLFIQALTSNELLMVLLGGGLQDRDVSTIALNILKVIESEKERISLEALMKIRGICNPQ